MSYFQRTKQLMIYCEQLQKLSDVQKRPELINRKGVSPRQCETTQVIRQKLLQHGWDVLLHPYSPDLASDFHFFRSLQNSLNGKTFASEDLIK